MFLLILRYESRECGQYDDEDFVEVCSRREKADGDASCLLRTMRVGEHRENTSAHSIDSSIL